MHREKYEDAVRKFLTGIRQNSPGLFVPVHRNLAVGKLGPRLAVFRTYSELSDAGDSVEKYWETLNNVSFIPACGTLSAINLVLSAGAIDQKAHAALNRTFLRDEYLKKPSRQPTSHKESCRCCRARIEDGPSILFPTGAHWGSVIVFEFHTLSNNSFFSVG